MILHQVIRILTQLKDREPYKRRRIADNLIRCDMPIDRPCEIGLTVMDICLKESYPMRNPSEKSYEGVCSVEFHFFAVCIWIDASTGIINEGIKSINRRTGKHSMVIFINKI